jgi:putative heme iron utilization protein
MADGFLASVLERSLDEASPLTRRVFGRRSLSADDVESFLTDERLATLATCKGEKPHASVGSFAYTDGCLYFYSNRMSVRHRNIVSNGNVAVTVLEGWKKQVIVMGQAKIIGLASSLKTHWAAEAFRRKYGKFAGDSEGSSFIIELIPEKIFTWTNLK